LRGDRDGAEPADELQRLDRLAVVTAMQWGQAVHVHTAILAHRSPAGRAASCRRRAARSVRAFLEIAVKKLLRELDALELEKLRVRLDPSVERQGDRPRSLEHLGVVDRRLVLEVIR